MREYRHCYCGREPLPCRYGCDPEMRPSLVRARARQAREAQRKARVAEEGILGLQAGETRKRMAAAIAKFDPVAAHKLEQRRRAAQRSHGPGSKRYG